MVFPSFCPPLPQAVRVLTESDWRRAQRGDLNIQFPCGGALPKVPAAPGCEAVELLKLRRWHLALTAADCALTRASDPLAMEARAVALLMLQRPDEALLSANKLPQNWPRARRLRADIARASRELRGEFNVNEMLREANVGYSSSDMLEGDCTPRGTLSRRHADYKAPGVVKSAGGSQVITLTALAPGTIVMAAKAFVFLPGPSDGSVHSSVAWDGSRGDLGEGANFTAAVVQEVSDRPETAEELYSLSGGHDWPPGPPKYPGAIDVPRITNIVYNNWMEVVVVGHKDALWYDRLCAWTANAGPVEDQAGLETFSEKVCSKSGTGLWIAPSLLPHSCTPNCEFRFVGDFIFVTTNRDVSAGSVLTLSFRDTLTWTFKERTETFASWNEGAGFECACPMCTACRACPSVVDFEAKACKADQVAQALVEKGLHTPHAAASVAMRGEESALIHLAAKLPNIATAVGSWWLHPFRLLAACESNQRQVALQLCEQWRCLVSLVVGVSHFEYITATLQVAWCAEVAGKSARAAEAVKCSDNRYHCGIFW
jgi:hypothetical protein